MAGIFDRITGVDRVELDAVFPKVSVAAGEFLCKFGDPAKEMYIIVSGEVEILRPRRKEGEFDTIGTLAAGQMSGEAALMGTFPRNASMRAKDAVEVMVVTRAALQPLKTKNPRLLMLFYDGIFEQIGERFYAIREKKTSELFS